MQFNPIGQIESPYKEKFGIPRQPGLAPAARAILRFVEPYNTPEAFQGLEGYSHIWVQFIFHQSPQDRWQPRVRPPRLGGNQKVGVFATRSPFRPNPIGLSVVKLESVNATEGDCWLELSGVDLLDGTPVLDIKPYVAYVDSLPGAVSGFAKNSPEKILQVAFSEHIEKQLEQREDGVLVRAHIAQLLALDPRPAYKGDAAERVYGMHLYDFDLRWRVMDNQAEVLELEYRKE